MKSSLIILSLVSTLVIGNPVEKRQAVPYALPMEALSPQASGVAFTVAESDISNGTVTYDPGPIMAAAVAEVSALLQAGATGGAVAVVLTASPALQTAAPTAVEKRAPVVVCTSRIFNGMAMVPDTPAAFVANPIFASTASEAATPTGYTAVPNFVALKKRASVLIPQYLGYSKTGLTSYSPAVCAAKCNKISGCYSFNIFFERNIALVNPATSKPDPFACPASVNSPSGTYIKCAFFGVPLLATHALWNGQTIGAFRVVIAGSNAYVKVSPPKIANYQGPVAFGMASINIPVGPTYGVAEMGYLGVQTFPAASLYNPLLCTATCQAITAYNLAHPGTTLWGSSLSSCNFINTYMVWRNGINGVFTCAYYASGWSAAYATNVGQYDAAGNHITVSNSQGYYVNGHLVN